MLSERVNRITLSPTLRINARATQMREQGIDVVDFSVGEPDFPTPETVKRAGKAAIDANFTKYTANDGIPELKKAICDKLERENGLRYSPDEVIVSAGGDGTVRSVIEGLMRLPGKRPALGILACGTMNNIAASFGICVNSFLKNTKQSGTIFGGVLVLTGMLGMISVFAQGSPGAETLSNTVALLVPQGWAIRGLMQAMNGAPLRDVALTSAVMLRSPPASSPISTTRSGG